MVLYNRRSDVKIRNKTYRGNPVTISTIFIYISDSFSCLVPLKKKLNIKNKIKNYWSCVFTVPGAVAEGINEQGPLGGKQGFQPYPSGPSRNSTKSSLGHLCSLGCSNTLSLNNLVFISCYILCFRRQLKAYFVSTYWSIAVVAKINDISFFLSYFLVCYL